MAAGLPQRAIYREGRGAENVSALVVATRKHQRIGLSHGLRILGGSHAAIAHAVSKIHKKGGVLIDALTAERSDKDGITMFSRALGMLRGEITMADRAEEIGRLGGLAKGRSAALNRMPEGAARRIWLSPKYATDDLAIARMWGWKVRTARRRLGPSGRPEGRRKWKT